MAVYDPEGEISTKYDFIDVPVKNEIIFPAFSSSSTPDHVSEFEGIDAGYRLALFEGNSTNIDDCLFVGGFDIESAVNPDEKLIVMMRIDDGCLKLKAKLGENKVKIDFCTRVARVGGNLRALKEKENISKPALIDEQQNNVKTLAAKFTGPDPTPRKIAVANIACGRNDTTVLDHVNIEYVEGILRVYFHFPPSIKNAKEVKSYTVIINKEKEKCKIAPNFEKKEITHFHSVNEKHTAQLSVQVLLRLSRGITYSSPKLTIPKEEEDNSRKSEKTMNIMSKLFQNLKNVFKVYGQDFMFYNKLKKIEEDFAAKKANRENK